MKAKIRKTGEIVDIICYGGSPNRRSDVLDYVNYIDSQGVEHTEANHLNYYWDFEPIENEKDHDLDTLRNQAAIAAMIGFLSRQTYQADLSTLAKDSVKLANCLIEELKEK